MESKNEILKNLKSLWKNCELKENNISDIDKYYVNKITLHKSRYEEVADIIGCPWYAIGIIHGLECNYNFNTHLHNGDSLERRTYHVPKNRPASGT